MSVSPVNRIGAIQASSKSKSSTDQRVWMSGDEYTILVDRHTSNGMMTVVGALVPPGGGPPVHVHLDADELFIVLEGNVEIIVDQQTFYAASGNQIFVARGVPHAFTNRSLVAARMLLVYTPSGIEDFFLAAGVPVSDGELPPVPTPDSTAREVATAVQFNTVPPLNDAPQSGSSLEQRGKNWDVIGDNSHDR